MTIWFAGSGSLPSPRGQARGTTWTDWSSRTHAHAEMRMIEKRWSCGVVANPI